MSALRRHLPAVAGTSAFWIILFGAYLLFGQRRPQPQPIQILPPPTSSAPTQAEATATPGLLRVYVSGAVQQPGVYRLTRQSLVEDAVAAAGGATTDADLVAINLAHPLSDGEQVYVPQVGEAAAPPPPSAQTIGSDSGFQAGDLPAQSGQPLDLNTATAAEMEALPGIGPKTAEAIIGGRPYSQIEDLLRVKGIGDATLDKLRPFIIVR